jgi:FkbM family methyltransferase
MAVAGDFICVRQHVTVEPSYPQRGLLPDLPPFTTVPAEVSLSHPLVTGIGTSKLIFSAHDLGRQGRSLRQPSPIRTPHSPFSKGRRARWLATTRRRGFERREPKGCEDLALSETRACGWRRARSQWPTTWITRRKSEMSLVGVARARASRLARRILIGRFAEISFSQEGEDRILSRMFEGLGPGFYVDIGAHDPDRFSNTALLYGRGWHGINVDPRPGVGARFARRRPRDKTIEVGIAAVAGWLDYFEFDDEALNTFSRARAETLKATTPYRLVQTRSIPVLTLAELLDQQLPPGQEIDLLCVDAEGLDLEVLRSNDWARFRPKRLVVEDLEGKPLDEMGTFPVAAFLRPLGYRPVAKTVNSVFFERFDER